MSATLQDSLSHLVQQQKQFRSMVYAKTIINSAMLYPLLSSVTNPAHIMPRIITAGGACLIAFACNKIGAALTYRRVLNQARTHWQPILKTHPDVYQALQNGLSEKKFAAEQSLLQHLYA